MKYFISEHNHEKYRPRTTFKDRLVNRFSKKHKQMERPTTSRREQAPWCNPYRQNQSVGILKRVWVWILLFIILMWLGMVLYLPYFQINKVTVVGPKITKPTEIENFVRDHYLNKGGILPKNNFFLIHGNKIVSDLKKNFAIENITINKIFPHELFLDIEEKISSIIYDDGASYYLLDQNGKVIRTLAAVSEREYVIKNIPTHGSSTTPIDVRGLLGSVNTSTTIVSGTIKVHIPDFAKIKGEYGDLPLLYDMRFTTTTDEIVLVPPQLVQSIITVNQQMQKQGIGKNDYFVVDNLLAGIEAMNENVCDFYFDPRGDINFQLQNFKEIIKTNQPKQYVDLRYGNRVYWR